jgi:hypothetical protein
MLKISEATLEVLRQTLAHRIGLNTTNELTQDAARKFLMSEPV